MVAKTRAQLKIESDDSFETGTPARSVDHRAYNDNQSDSVVNLSDPLLQQMLGPLRALGVNVNFSAQSVNNTNASFRLNDENGNNRSEFIYIGNVVSAFRWYDVNGVTEGYLQFQSNGNVILRPSTVPTNDDDIVTKKYVPSTHRFARTLPTVINDAVDIGLLTAANGAGSYHVLVACHSTSNSVAKQYIFDANYNNTNNTWQQLMPVSDSGAYSGLQDFEVDIKVNKLNLKLRIRRTLGTLDGDITVTVMEESDVVSITPSTDVNSVTPPTTIFDSREPGKYRPRLIFNETSDFALRSEMAGNMVWTGTNGGKDVDIPPDSTLFFSIGTEIVFEQTQTTSVLTFVPGSGVLLESLNGLRSTAGQFGIVRLMKKAANRWSLSGDLV